MPKVSAIIITYNRSKLLSAAIKSVLNQTYEDFELIVVDDASKDDTTEVVQAFNDKRIRYIRHDTNKREAGARNTGIQYASGEYIAFLDDDDEWLPEKLQKQVDLLNNSPLTVGVVYTGFLRIDRTTGKTLVHMTPTKRGNILQDIIVQNWVGLSTVLVKKACFEKVGLFDENIAFGLDYDMWMRISKEFQFEFIDQILVKYFVHETNLSTQYELMIKGLEGLLEKNRALFAIDRKSYSLRYCTLGVFYCYNRNMKKGREAFLKAIAMYPFDVRHYLNFCLSLLGANNFRFLRELREKLI